MKKSPLRKPRLPQSKLLQLEDDKQFQIIDWLLTGVPYPTIHEKIKNQFGVSLKFHTPIERFWKRIAPVVMRWQKFRPQGLTKLGWEMIRQSYLKKLEDPATTPEQRKSIIKFLETGRFPKSKSNALANDQEFEPSAASSETGEAAADENPLDDQEKLDEIRRQVFGSAPNTKKSDPPTS